MKKKNNWAPGLGGQWLGENQKPSPGSTLTIGRKNSQCNIKKIRRNTVLIKPGEEFKIRVLNRVYIVRGLGGPSVPGGLQIYGRDYISDKSKKRRIYAGSIHGIVQGNDFCLGYSADITYPLEIPTIDLSPDGKTNVKKI